MIREITPPPIATIMIIANIDNSSSDSEINDDLCNSMSAIESDFLNDIERVEIKRIRNKL